MDLGIIDAVSLGAELLQGTVEVGGAIRKMTPVRQCRIDITNNSKCYLLHNPGTYTLGGKYADPLSPRIQPSSSGAALVLKTPYTGRGFSGVFTYDLRDSFTRETAGRMAVLFKVPYNTNLRQNEYAVGIFDVGRECDENLYEHLAKNTDLTIVRGQAKGPSLTFASEKVTIRATMSEKSTAVIKVDLDDD
uniref:Uncharacterized protein n=1 Tax=Fundulus heteroclitus TaxID=8078 RepID=A0A3Q2SMW9_FUNHE